MIPPDQSVAKRTQQLRAYILGKKLTIQLSQPHVKIYLVGVFHDEVFAIIQFGEQVYNHSKDTPRVIHVQVHLLSKLSRLKLLDAQNGVIT